MVRAGYKQTEVGVIPEDWETVELGNCIVKVGSGITPTGGSRVYKTSGRPFVRSQNVGWGSLILDDLVYIDENTHQTFPETEIKTNDVLLNITGASIGRCSLANDRVVEGNVNQHVCIIRTIKEELNPKFLNLFLLSSVGQKQIDSFQAGGNRQGLNFSQIRSFIVMKPKLIKEQRAIAGALADVDALIAALDRLIAKKRAVKTAVMQQLLTGKVRLPGFGEGMGYKQTEVGVIPEDWMVQSVDSLFDISGGLSASRDQLSSDGHCYLHYGDIHKSEKTYINVLVENVNIPKLDISLKRVPSKLLLSDGDVVFVDASEDDEGTSKHIVVINKENIPFISGLHTIVLKSKNNTLDNIYKQYCFQSRDIKRQFYFYSVGIKVSGISKTNIGKILLPLPKPEEQRAIAEALADVDDEISVLQIRRDKTIAIKQGMMQELLTGKTRLPD